MWQSLIIFSILIGWLNAKSNCGGIFTAARGILQTPNFPNEFPIPLQCEWIIDAQHLSSSTTSNTSIIVYLTQLYVHEGLTFTEYQVYDRTYQINARLIHKVNETNIVQIRWLQSFQNYLVIKLKIDNIHGTHVRVLDQFLNIFGFNITYEITRNSVRSNSCTAMDCGFNGNCYDHYTKFSCDCFPGYSGPHCSLGDKSFCMTDRKPTCQNGGSCMHVGVSAVKCYCQKGYTGDTCQIAANSNIKLECDNCLISCPFNGQLENACACNKYTNNATTTHPDRLAFTTTLNLSNLPNLKGNDMKTYLESQIFKAIKTNYSKLDNVTIDNISHYRSGADITFHFFAQRKDEKRVKTILTKFTERGSISNLTITDKLFTFKPLLELQSLTLNQAGMIRENDQFILSCVAKGSSTMKFHWYKNGLLINVTKITNKWHRIIKDPHSNDQYTALLGIEQSSTFDDGIFTCQVEDFRVQQCLSKRVRIRSPPNIRIEPMSLTVRKGANLTIKCISISDDTFNKYTYSWTKNKELLPVRTMNEKYEILYPGGSILQVFSIERSTKYSCLVQDEVVSNEITIRINVIDPDLIKMCPNDSYLEIKWPETAPDTDSLQQCPKGYNSRGFIKRSCLLNDGKYPVWQQPDYSQCTSKYVYKLENSLQLLRSGYQTQTPTTLLANLLNYLNNSTMFPGEGARILKLINEILYFIMETSLIKIQQNNFQIIFTIIDRILSIKLSIVNQEDIKLLQEIIDKLLNLFGEEFLENHESIKLNFTTVCLIIEKTRLNNVQLSFNNNKNERSSDNRNWTPTDAQIQINNLYEENLNNDNILASIIYKNLSEFLPIRSVLRLRDGIEIEYEILSEILHLWSLKNNNLIKSVTTDWKLSNILLNKSNDGWYIKCAITEIVTYGYTWDTNTCQSIIINSTNIRCVCPKSGTFSILLITNNNILVEKDDKQQIITQYVVLAGCMINFLLTVICTILLIIHWLIKHSYIIFLKIQCSLSIGVVMLIFILIIINEPISEKFFTNIQSLLEMFFLMSISAHISSLLIIYIELVEFKPKIKTTNEMVIGISTGVPIISVFGNHLVHRTMNIKLNSWWLLIGTLAFHIFITIIVVIIILFILLYIIVLKKLNHLIVIDKKLMKRLEKRISLIKKSALVFFSIIITIISSIFYTNHSNLIWLHYQFCSSVMILGFILIICYIIRSESEINYLFTKKLQSRKTKKNIFRNESVGRPLNFFTKEDADLENESMPNSHKPDIQQNSPKNSKEPETYLMTDLRKLKTNLPECISGTMESFMITNASNKLNEQRITQEQSYECYNKSPQFLHNNKKIINTLQSIKQQDRPGTNDCLDGPDVISTKICTEFDLIASHSTNLILSPDEAINNILLSNQAVENEIEIVQTTDSTTVDLNDSNKDKLDGMLDRISHDLDYLLNRSGEYEANNEDNTSNETITQSTSTAIQIAPHNCNNLRKISKPPGLSVIQQIQEEIEEESKINETVTEILRTNC